ncbi:carbohydrate kinase family protein [Oceanithermus profundus]
MIAVLGEALVDLLPAERPGLWRARAGGSPANVALGLGRLGVPARFYGGLSRDGWGRWIRDRLRAAGVEAAGPFSEDPTPLARVEAGAAEEARYRFYLRGTAFEAAGWPQAGEGVRAVHAGSLAAALPPAADEVWGWLERLEDAFVSFDPNVRPGLTPAAFRGVFWERLDRFDLVKLSAADLDWLAESEDRDAALARLRAVVPWVVLTLGAGGAVGFCGAHEVHVPPPRVRVVDTVGAGDAFTAGLLAWAEAAGVFGGAPLDRAGLTAALVFACRVAGLTLERVGADPPTRKELEARGGEVCGA